MANVDKATRILNFVASNDYSKLNPCKKKEVVNNFASLVDSFKPSSFRGVSKDSIEKYFNELNMAITKSIKQNLEIKDFILTEDGNDNRIGADLNIISMEDSRLVRKVELKFGSETNRNIGNNTMDKIFKIVDSSKTFTSIFQKIRIKQQEFVDSNQNATDLLIDNNLKQILKSIVIYLRKLLEDKKILIDSAMMAQLLVTTGSLENLSDQESMIKLSVGYNKDINKAVNILDTPNVHGNWKISTIEMAPSSTRIVIWVENNFIKTKFLLNWKNNKTYNGIKYSAKLGLGSVSWNVWISLP